MKYQQHDFIGNIVQYQRTGQDDKVRKLVMDELAQLIHYHRGHVITALNKAGIPTTKSATDAELVKKLSDNLGTNQKLNRSLSSLLALLNTPSAGPVVGGMKFNAAGNPACPCDTYNLWGKCLCSTTGKGKHSANGYYMANGYYSGDGSEKAGSSGGSGSSSSSGGSGSPSSSGGGGAFNGLSGGGISGGPISAIGNAISGIFGFAKSKVDAKTQADTNRQQLAQQLLANKQATGSTGSNTTLYVVLGILAVVGIGYAIYRSRKGSSIPTSASSATGHQAPTSPAIPSSPATGAHATA